jgi:hypothetical protein
MPLSIFKKLGLGELKRTMIKIQLADSSILSPYGRVEDIIVKVDNVMIPTDFIICEMEEDKEVPLILGRPFLRTGRALIDVHEGELTLRVNDKEVKFNVHKAMKYPNYEKCCAINAVDALVRVLTSEEENEDEEGIEYVKLMEEGMEIEQAKPLLEELKPIELKPLPDPLQYEFLRSTDTFPVNIFAGLTGMPEEEPRVWKKQKTGIGQHEIILDDKVNPYVLPQRRLNINMKEVDRKEIIK